MKISGLKSIIKEAVKEALEEFMEQQHVPEKPISKAVPFSTPPPPPLPKDPLQSIFEQTRREMTSADAKNFLGDGAQVVGGDFQAQPLQEQPDFVKNAAAIFKKSLQKSVGTID